MSYKSEPEQVLELVKEIGTWRLGNWDGCCCCSFAIRNVNISISCGKGTKQGVYVYSDSLDYSEGYSGGASHDEMLKPIAEEVQRQVKERSNRSGDFPIAYRAWDRKLDI